MPVFGLIPLISAVVVVALHHTSAIFKKPSLENKVEHTSTSATSGTIIAETPEAVDISPDPVEIAGGIVFDVNCSERFGESFVSYAQEVLQTGLQCMRNLKGPMVWTHIERARKLVSSQEKPLQIRCQRRTDVLSLIGEASTPKNPDHPWVWLSPDYGYPKQELKTTIWHEFVHLLGHKHGPGIEYADTCEQCCMPEEGQSPESVRFACNVCAGKYQNPRDPQYLVELQKLLRVKNTWSAFFRARDYLNRFPQDRMGWMLFVQSLDRPASVNLAYYAAEEFARRFSPLSDEETAAVLPILSEDRKQIAEYYKDSSLAAVQAYFLALDGRVAESEAMLKAAVSGPAAIEIPFSNREQHELRIVGIRLMKNSAVYRILDEHRMTMNKHKSDIRSAAYVSAQAERERIRNEFQIQP